MSHSLLFPVPCSLFPVPRARRAIPPNLLLELKSFYFLNIPKTDRDFSFILREKAVKIDV